MGEIVAVSKEFCGFELKYLLFDSEPWFKGKVVANALGYSDTDQALRKHVENDDKKKLGKLRPVSQTGSDGGDPNAWKTLFRHESGLYSLIMKSTKPDAKLFQQWVTKEVLPSIRKTGSYESPAPIPTPLPLENPCSFWIYRKSKTIIPSTCTTKRSYTFKSLNTSEDSTRMLC